MPGTWRVLIFTLASLFFLSGQAPAANLEQSQGSASMIVTGGKLEKGILHIRLSDEITVVMRVESESPPKVEATKPASGPVWLVRSATPARTKLERKTHRWQRSFSYEPQQTGEQTLPLPQLKYQEKGAWRNATWKPVQVKITTQIKNPTAANLRGMPNIEELPSPSYAWVLFAVGGGATVTALTGLIMVLLLFLRRRSRPIISEPPEQIALRQLGQLKSEQPESEEASAVFHARLAEILRTYLERKHQVSAGHHTTAEFLLQLAGREIISATELSTLAEILHHCDLSKFAPVPVGPDDCQSVLDLAKSFVETSANSYNDGTKQSESDTHPGGKHERARSDSSRG